MSNYAFLDRHYLRTFTATNSGTWEQIELDAMLNEANPTNEDA